LQEALDIKLQRIKETKQRYPADHDYLEFLEEEAEMIRKEIDSRPKLGNGGTEHSDHA
jgi:hypothetical protein